MKEKPVMVTQENMEKEKAQDSEEETAEDSTTASAEDSTDDEVDTEDTAEKAAA